MIPLAQTVLRACALVTLALLFIAPTNAQSQSPIGERLRAAPYDGKWTGVVNCLYDPGLWPEDECAVHFTLNIRGPLVLVEQIVRSKKGEETKSNINPGKFTFVRVSTNAIATSIDAGKDEDGLWVETWVFAMTLIDPDRMLVHWTRMVNNTDMANGQKGSKFSSAGMGEFTRFRPGI